MELMEVSVPRRRILFFGKLDFLNLVVTLSLQIAFVNGYSFGKEIHVHIADISSNDLFCMKSIRWKWTL